MRMAQTKTVVLASSREIADKLASRIGVEKGVAARKKLGVDYRLFGPDGVVVSRPSQKGTRKGCNNNPETGTKAGKKKTKTQKNGSKAIGKQALARSQKKKERGSFATREARLAKASKWAAKPSVL